MIIHSVMYDSIVLFCVFILAHVVADYPGQDGFLTRFNSHKSFYGKVFWFHTLTSHSFIHGLLVGLITGSFILGVCEFVSHWFIDLGRGERVYSLGIDQLLHVGFKIILVFIYIFFI